jgi:hypothetical protein
VTHERRVSFGLSAEKSRENGGRSMPRLLYIVSRRNQQLYADLTRTFNNDPNVRVILDRREGERRRRAAPHRADRRVRDRRAVNIEEHLQRLGWAVADERPDAEGAR